MKFILFLLVYRKRVYIRKIEGKINKIIKYLNSFSYSDGSDLKLPNDSPDIFVFMYDENEKVIDRLMIYGKVIVYKDNKYKAPFLFDYRFERFCKRLNEDNNEKNLLLV